MNTGFTRRDGTEMGRKERYSINKGGKTNIPRCSVPVRRDLKGTENFPEEQEIRAPH